MVGISELRWPRSDYSRVPYSVFLDPELHALEQERIFRGPVWLNVGLEAEIPNPGDYLTSFAGDTFSHHDSDDADKAKEAYQEVGFLQDSSMRLNDPSVWAYRDEFDINMAANLCAVFPNVIFQQLSNSLATRQIRPRRHDEFELYWTYFGYADDDAELRELRMKNANIVGPAGFSSMEDGEVGRLCQLGIRGSGDEQSVIEMGGLGEIGTQYTTVTEVPMRGMWLNYCELMGISVAGAE